MTPRQKEDVGCMAGLFIILLGAHLIAPWLPFVIVLILLALMAQDNL